MRARSGRGDPHMHRAGAISGLLCAIITCTVAAALSPPARGEPAWMTYHRDAARSGADPEAGTPVNPKIVETQLTGAAVMQLGFSLFEEMQFTEGQLRNPNLAEYKIPGIRDLPAQLEGESVESRQETGPYGAKGVGETGTFAITPALANAIEDAIGVRITELPITPEAVYRALRRAAGDPLPED